ncbi:hypothetical protein ACLOJK_002179 [Asimina triloba]
MEELRIINCSPPMGCSASKAVPNGEGEKGTGLFHRRERKRTKSGGTLSSKELLANEHGTSDACSKRLPESYDDLDKEEPQIKDPDLHEKKISEGALEEKNVVSAGGSDERKVSGSSDEKKVRGESDEKRISGSLDEKKVSGESDDKKVSGGASNDKGEEEEEEVVVVVELGFGDVPSSPSFREYFKSAENLENGDSGKVIGIEEGKDCGIVRKRKDSTDSNEEAEGKMVKRGGGKLRVLAKGPGVMYKSFSIKSCYSASATDSPRPGNVKAN